MSAGTELEERLNDYASEPNIELEVGGRLRFTQPQFTENRAIGEKSNPADPIVHETDDPSGYITVHYQNGNYEWFEFNFRVRDGVAYYGGKVRLDSTHNSRGWIPPEVKDTIVEHHPEIEVSSEAPPWWG